MKTRIAHIILFWFLFLLPYLLLKFFFFDTGWIGVFLVFYIISPVLFGLYLYLLKKQQAIDTKHFSVMAILFIAILSFIFWDIYNIILAGFNFKML